MADGLTTFRLCVKEVARELGLYATFMPKPSERLAGSGLHLHMSLFDGDRNAFYSESPSEPLSELGQELSRRRARAFGGARGGDQPMGQLVQAPRRRVRGARARRLDARGAGVARAHPSNRPARSPPPGSAALAGPGLQSYLALRCCSPQGCAGSNADTSCGPEANACRPGASTACRRTCARRPTPSMRPSSRARRSVTRSATGTCATSGATGRTGER